MVELWGWPWLLWSDSPEMLITSYAHLQWYRMCIKSPSRWVLVRWRSGVTLDLTSRTRIEATGECRIETVSANMPCLLGISIPYYHVPAPDLEVQIHEFQARAPQSRYAAVLNFHDGFDIRECWSHVDSWHRPHDNKQVRPSHAYLLKARTRLRMFIW